MKKRWIVAILLSLLFVFVVVISFLQRPSPTHPFFANFEQHPLVFAHADDTGQGLWPGNTMPFLSNLLSPAYNAFQVPEKSSGIPVVTPRFVQAAHDRNLQVHVWTINDPAEMQRLIEMGVDGIITDRPDILLEILGRS